MGEGRTIDDGISIRVLLLFGAVLRVLLSFGMLVGALLDEVLGELLDSSCDIHAPAQITIFFVV